jgi:hypothetical protein
MEKDIVLLIILFALSALLNLAFMIVFFQVWRTNNQPEPPKKTVLNP